MSLVDKVIPSNHIDPDNIKCPECGGNNLVLGGFAQKPYAVRTTAGVVTDEALDDSPWRHDVREIQCQSPNCKTTTKVMSAELWAALRAQGTGRPC